MTPAARWEPRGHPSSGGTRGDSEKCGGLDIHHSGEGRVCRRVRWTLKGSAEQDRQPVSSRPQPAGWDGGARKSDLTGGAPGTRPAAVSVRRPVGAEGAVPAGVGVQVWRGGDLDYSECIWELSAYWQGF